MKSNRGKAGRGDGGVISVFDAGGKNGQVSDGVLIRGHDQTAEDGSRITKQDRSHSRISLLFPLLSFATTGTTVSHRSSKDSTMEKPTVDHGSDSSNHSPANEKMAAEEGALEALGLHQLPPDPDAHLSEAERAAIVSSEDAGQRSFRD